MRMSETDEQLMLILLQKYNRFTDRPMLQSWLSLLPTKKRPANVLNSTQLESLTGYTRAYIRRRMEQFDVPPAMIIPHRGRPQKYWLIADVQRIMGLDDNWEPMKDKSTDSDTISE